MKVQTLSDLHTETSAYRLENPEHYKTGAPIVVIAGDIARCSEVTHIISHLFPSVYTDGTPGPRYIVITTGNHEHYLTNESIDDGHIVLKESIKQWNLEHSDQEIIFLDDSIREIELDNTSIRLIGGTLWTDFDLYYDKLRDARTVAGALNDYRLIRGKNEGKLKTSEVSERFQKTHSLIQDAVNKPFNGPTIVVTHHLPSMKAVDDYYRRDRVSAGFASNLDYLLNENVTLWVCGHTHSSSVTRFESNALLVCNPAGYMRGASGERENKQFDPKLLIDIRKGAPDNKWIAGK